MATPRTPRVLAARKLIRRSERERAGRFLAEGRRAVAEALSWSGDRGGGLHELFVTPRAAERNRDLLASAAAADVAITEVTERAAAVLSDTATPQGLVAVCSTVWAPLPEALAGATLVVALVGIADPGNAGTVIRTADAAGAGAVLLLGDTVDVHNGKCVRASAGSVFHLPLARKRDPLPALAACRVAGLRILAADGHGQRDLDCLEGLGEPTLWVFGGESHGLDDAVFDHASATVRVPLHGRAESLNLATAAALCLYASARVRR